MKLKFLSVIAFIGLGLIMYSCNSNLNDDVANDVDSTEVVEDVIEEPDTMVEEIQEEVVEEVEPTPVKKKAPVKKEEKPVVMEAKQAPGSVEKKGGIGDAYKQEAVEKPVVEKKKTLKDLMNEGN